MKCLRFAFLLSFSFFYQNLVCAMQAPVPGLNKEAWILVFDHVYEQGENANTNPGRMYDLMRVCREFKECAPLVVREMSFIC